MPVNALLTTGVLARRGLFDLDFDHQFIETEKHDAEPTYKKFLGYGVGVAVIEDMIVGIEAMDGNTNVHFHQQDTQQGLFERLERNNITIDRFRADCGSYSKEIIEVVEALCKRLYIRVNHCNSLYDMLFALCGRKSFEINIISLELNSIFIEKWGKPYRLVIQRQKRMDGVSDLWEGEYIYRCILTNDFEVSEKNILVIAKYNKKIYPIDCYSDTYFVS